MLRLYTSLKNQRLTVTEEVEEKPTTWKKTGDFSEDLKQIFPKTFDRQVGLFERVVSLKLSPEAKPVQLPPRAVPQKHHATAKEGARQNGTGRNRTSLPRNY